MNEITYIICLPIFAGILLFVIPEKLKTIKGIFASAISLYALYQSILVFTGQVGIYDLSQLVGNTSISSLYANSLNDAAKYVTFNIDSLSQLIILFVNIFAFLIVIYSLFYIDKKKKVYNYYAFFLITLGTSNGAVLSNNLLLFLTFWGILGFTLYKLIKGADEESSSAAKKTLAIVGASDGIMILGIAIIWKITNTLSISELHLATNNALTITAFITLLIGSFTKAGAFPFHTWVPDYAKNAPASSSAYMPASLDKLLGIYFLARICNNIFELNQWLTLILLSIGVITIITAVMMALVQHNYKRLLGFHAVSQVGYMIVGFGLGSVIGIAAGLFHMLNNVLYKTGLFLVSGNVEKQTGKSDIDDLSGLSKTMPITFMCALIFALSISGIPPFNGFASKWMIYQGIIEFGQGTGIANQLWIVWLGLAVLGSALTLASFVKFISGLFLGRRQKEFEKVKEVNILGWLPISIMAIGCIVFGVFSTNYFVPKLFNPILGEINLIGMWNSTSVSVLVLASIVLGLIIYMIGNIKNFRSEDSYVGGGETMREDSGMATSEFYETIRNLGFLSTLYDKAEKRYFDIYNISKKIILWFSKGLQGLHTGVLTNYALWIFAGLIIMLLILL
ncbi:MAG: proton-conducting transporter membrane subunit [Bacteroidales bacterium]|jgi:formate hydrogenlyase subunit 3/multisubunit Na+/H+ antiporter MnhD subunit|nr:proton-conducting transporter membrane subunit [Bacteroidales bacterium]